MQINIGILFFKCVALKFELEEKISCSICCWLSISDSKLSTKFLIIRQRIVSLIVDFNRSLDTLRYGCFAATRIDSQSPLALQKTHYRATSAFVTIGIIYYRQRRWRTVHHLAKHGSSNLAIETRNRRDTTGVMDVVFWIYIEFRYLFFCISIFLLYLYIYIYIYIYIKHFIIYIYIYIFI